MKTRNLFVTIIIFLSFFFLLLWGGVGGEALAQGQANIWYFGRNAGLDFNGGAPVAVTNGQVNTTEGSASISDAAGNLLFYTDGVKVWNKNHLQMPNGFGLNGHISSTQSSIIIQKPGSATSYYIFTTDAFGFAKGLRYTEIDMTLNAGLGDVTANKNILLNTPTCEKLTAIKHCNKQDIWVITHDWKSNAFRTYLVTPAGVNTNAVVSNAGLVADIVFGQLKGSPDGTKLASAMSDPVSRFELFDFNRSTGIVSKPILFPPFPATHSPYGVEFSADGTKMYGSITLPLNIYQYNLCAGDSTAIANSGVMIGTSVSANIGSLQLGPDKKIYVARYNEPWAGVINSPDTLGAGCNYVDNGVSQAGKNGSLGLTNFAPWYFNPALPSFTVSVNCLAGTFTAPTVNLTNCSGSASAITSVLWNFGDPASGGNNISNSNNTIHTFTGIGTYTVTLILNYACGSDTIQQNVTISSALNLTTIPTNISCNGGNNGSAVANVSNGASPYTYLWNTTPVQNTTNAIGLIAGIYTVTATDANGCTSAQTVTIAEPPALAIVTSITPTSCNANTGTAIANATGGTGVLTYLWNPTSQSTQAITGLGLGNYFIMVTDSNGCSNTTVATIEPSTSAAELYLPNAFSPNNDGENDELCLQGGTGDCIKEFSINIYDRWGVRVYESIDKKFCWDGTCQGKQINTSVFVYYINANLTDGKQIRKKGNVSLIR